MQKRLNEEFNSFEYQKIPLEEQEKRGILGRLAGKIAEWKAPTRNGRLYGKQLWSNLFSDPIFVEKVKNRVCYGEIEHPTDGRTAIDPQKIAVCLAEIPKIADDGFVYGVFDILNTACGKILKTLLDYGSTVAVSSRGQGDLFTNRRGQEEVDPDSYECTGWDVVFVPGVVEARPQIVTESLNSTKSLRESLNELVEGANDSDKELMKTTIDKIINESLRTATPYMLRNDGELIECYPVHPYIKCFAEISDKQGIENLITKDGYKNSLQWFYDNTKNEETRELIKSFVQSLLNCESFSYINEQISDVINFDFSTDKFVTDEAEIFSIYNNLNDTVNQEFCRVRTSDMLFGGSSGDVYFRISSVGFNWFGLIWVVVNQNKNFVSSVTICKDTATFGGTQQFYDHNGVIIKQLPTEDFLNLSGNAVVESLDNFKLDVDKNAYKKLSEGKCVNEAYCGLHPRFVNLYMDTMKEKYIKENFTENSDEVTPPINSANQLEQEDIEDKLPKSQKGKTLLFETEKDIAGFDFFSYDENGTVEACFVTDREDLQQLIKDNSELLIRIIDREKGTMVQIDPNECSNSDETCINNKLDELNEPVTICADDVQQNQSNKTDYIQDDQEDKEEVNDTSKIIESLQEALTNKSRIESEVLSLNEKLSVCYAKENQQSELIESLRGTIAEKDLIISESQKQEGQLEKQSKTIKQLNENLSESQSTIAALEKNKTELTERLQKVTNKNKTLFDANSKLTEDYNSLVKEFNGLNDKLKKSKAATTELQEDYSKKLSESNTLVEKYKKIATKAVGKYIDSQAVKLGVTPNEIKNKLPENYSFNDIDSVCESLQNSKISINMLPFRNPQKLSENMNIQIKSSKKEPILESSYMRFEDDDVDDALKVLAGI